MLIEYIMLTINLVTFNICFNQLSNLTSPNLNKNINKIFLLYLRNHLYNYSLQISLIHL
jgi:hypothetical protein